MYLFPDDENDKDFARSELKNQAYYFPNEKITIKFVRYVQFLDKTEQENEANFILGQYRSLLSGNAQVYLLRLIGKMGPRKEKPPISLAKVPPSNLHEEDLVSPNLALFVQI